MGRKAVVSGGTKDEIVAAARKMFFEKGFDGVTIRNLQREVGCEVGLFYYYFKSKEEVFDVVANQLEAQWREKLEAAVEKTQEDPKESLDRLFKTVGDIAEDFHREAKNRLHWSVEAAMGERLIGISEELVVKILEYMGVRGTVALSQQEQAAIIAGGLGRLAMKEKSNGYRERIDYVLGAAGIQGYASSNRRREISVELL